MNPIDKALANRVKDLPEIMINGESYAVGRWTYAISCWYRDAYGDEPFNTPERFSHVISKLIPDLLEKFNGDLSKLTEFISSMTDEDILLIDNQIAYSIELSTGTRTVKKPIKKAVKMRVKMIVISSLLIAFSLGIIFAFLIYSLLPL